MPKKGELQRGKLPGRRVFRPRPGTQPSLGSQAPKPRVTKGTASFIWCHWGDNQWMTAGQEQMRLKRAMDGYDFKVLMKHNETPSWLDFSEGDERNADIMMPPTVANFTERLCWLANEGYMIDIFVFSHGADEEFLASTGTFTQKDKITASTIRALPAAAGLAGLPIRMVYQTQCHASTLNAAWRDAGAKISVGARYIQFYPNQFGNFIGEWNSGSTVSQANAGADGNWVRTQAQSYILADALARGPHCPFGRTVLGKQDCARDYFIARWLKTEEWQDNMSGKENMNFSSRMMLRGDRQLSKSSRPSW
jgi:hypothetical protein